MPGRYLLKASDFQPSDDPAKLLAEKREGAIATAVYAALDTIIDAVDAAEVHKLTQDKTPPAIAAVLASPRVVDALRQGYEPIAETFLEAAQNEAEEKFGGLVVYDSMAAAAELAGARQTFMGSILGQSADVVADTLIEAARRGADPTEVADALKAVIGLNRQQAAAVLNYRRLLEGSSRQALSRALRDRRFDATVRAWADGAPLDLDKIDTMVARYGDRMLAYRAQMIARNESMNATVGGIRGAYTQAVNAGRLLATEVTRFWLVVPDEKLCPICGSIPLLNIAGVGVFEPYQSLEGPVLAPLAHVSCRCSEKYVTDLSRVAANPFALAA